MTRRLRPAAGTFALLAMTFSLAENVLASTCAPMPQMAPTSMASAGAPVADDCMVAVHGHERGDPGSEGQRHCPFGPAAASAGCTAAASLRASSTQVDGASSEATAAIPFDDLQQDLLLPTTLFHPPRA